MCMHFVSRFVWCSTAGQISSEAMLLLNMNMKGTCMVRLLDRCTIIRVVVNFTFVVYIIFKGKCHT